MICKHCRENYTLHQVAPFGSPHLIVCRACGVICDDVLSPRDDVTIIRDDGIRDDGHLWTQTDITFANDVSADVYAIIARHSRLGFSGLLAAIEQSRIEIVIGWQKGKRVLIADSGHHLTVEMVMAIVTHFRELVSRLHNRNQLYQMTFT